MNCLIRQFHLNLPIEPEESAAIAMSRHGSDKRQSWYINSYMSDVTEKTVTDNLVKIDLDMDLSSMKT